MKSPSPSLDTLRALLPVVGVVVVIVTGVIAGVELMLLVLGFFALLGVIALLWASVQSLTGQSPLTLDEALTLAAPSAEEEQKRAVLRALKDIEYELSVGKISPEDHAEFSARYRAEALRLMQRLDEGEKPALEQIQALVDKRLAERERLAEKKAKREKARDAAEHGDTAEAQTAEAQEERDEQDESDSSPGVEPEAAEAASAPDAADDESRARGARPTKPREDA